MKFNFPSENELKSSKRAESWELNEFATAILHSAVVVPCYLTACTMYHRKSRVGWLSLSQSRYHLSYTVCPVGGWLRYSTLTASWSLTSCYRVQSYVQLSQCSSSLQDFVDQIVSASTSSNVSRHSGEETVAGVQTNAEYQYMDNFTDEDFKGSGEYTQPMCIVSVCSKSNVQPLFVVWGGAKFSVSAMIKYSYWMTRQVFIM